MANLSNINGKFVVEQTTGYVGVGTTDPNYPIEVLNASAEIALNASGGSIYRLQSDSASNFIIRKEGVGDRLVINSAGNSIFAGNITASRGFFNAGATNVVATFTSTDATSTLQCIDGVGNVEFGANGNNFVVQPAGGVAQLTVGETNSTFAGDITFGDSHFIGDDADDNLLIQSSANENIIIDSLDDLFFRNSGTTNLTINGSGNATFAGKISSVKELVNINSANGIRSAGLESDSTGNIWLGTGTTAATINFVTGNSTNGTPSTNGVKRLTTNREGTDVYASFASNTFPFRVGYLNGSTYTPTFVIVDSGNVGIGETNPSEKLEVAGRIKIISTGSAHLILNGDTNNSGDTGEQDAIIDFMGDGDPGLYGFRINSENYGGATAMNFQEYLNGSYSSRLYINLDGNVGIGVTNPQGILSLKNQIANSGIPLTYSTVQQNVLNGYYTTGESPNRYTRYFDIACVGDGDGTNGGGNIRFLTNPIANDTAVERMRITSTGAISVGSSGTAYGAAGEVLTSNGNAAPSWQAAGGGGSAWPQEKMAVYTINSTTSNILIATMNSTTWHGNFYGGCLKFTINDTDYIQVSYVTIYTFLSGTNQWFFKGNTEMTTHNTGTNPVRYVFAFAGNNGSYGTTCTLKINRASNGGLGPVNVLVQAISSPDMFILN